MSLTKFKRRDSRDRLLCRREALERHIAALIAADEAAVIHAAMHAAEKERTRTFRQSTLLGVERRDMLANLALPVRKGRNRDERTASGRRRGALKARAEALAIEIAALDARCKALTVEIRGFPQRIIDARIRSVTAMEAARAKVERAQRHLAEAEAACRNLGIDPATVTATDATKESPQRALHIVRDRATAVA